jgi:acetyl-CoA carboxylase biotin carboxyl carrier protein
VAVWLARESEGKVLVIRAPMIGTFYRAKGPSELPFVEVDAPVRSGDTVGLVEAMKLINSVLADCGGKVGAIFAANGEMVEYGQPVLAIWKE